MMTAHAGWSPDPYQTIILDLIMNKKILTLILCHAHALPSRTHTHTRTNTQTNTIVRIILNKKLLCFTFTEYKGQNLSGSEYACLERSTVSKSGNLHEWSLDMEKPRNSTPQQLQFANDSPPIQEDEEDEEDNEECLECVEWNLYTCSVADSIELKCLNELEIILKRKLKDMEVDESAIHDKFKVLKQIMMCMLETINELKATLENERVKLKEVEEERAILVDHSKEQESNEQKLSKMVEDLKSQVVLLNNLVYGGKQQATKSKGESNSLFSAVFTYLVE